MKILLFLTMLFSCTQTENMFLDKVLSDFSDGSYYLSFDLNLSDYKGKVIIENSEFYYYLNQEKGIDEEKYLGLAKKILEGKESLNIQSSDFEKWGFIKVRSIELVSINAQKGIDDFTKVYFDGRVLKDGITDDEQTAIINQLFEWKIASNIDDETGYLIISTK